MTASTFSCVAMSPPLRGRDVRHIGNAKRGVALDGAVDDVDGVTAQHEIDERTRWSLPAVDLVLAHQVDERVPLVSAELGEFFIAVLRLAGAIDGADGRAIKIHIGRANVENARFQQRLAMRDR